jgi:Flp pilus assembly pilin Flp
MLELMKRFVKDEEGQDLVEYALLLVFLALAAIAILPTLGSSVNKVFSQSNSGWMIGQAKNNQPLLTHGTLSQR